MYILHMKLHNLKRSRWLQDKDVQIWRGGWSKRWDYSGRWLKGQKARSWSNIPRWFEGWQTPLVLKLPKLRWFKKFHKLITNYSVINIDRLQACEAIQSGDKVTPDMLHKLWLASKQLPVKILGQWKIDKKLTFEWIAAFSKSAKEAIQQSWWEIL